MWTRECQVRSIFTIRWFLAHSETEKCVLWFTFGHTTCHFGFDKPIFKCEDMNARESYLHFGNWCIAYLWSDLSCPMNRTMKWHEHFRDWKSWKLARQFDHENDDFEIYASWSQSSPFREWTLFKRPDYHPRPCFSQVISYMVGIPLLFRSSFWNDGQISYQHLGRSTNINCWNEKQMSASGAESSF